ncbi:LOW QUALITY PROTEIN: protein BNIP5 [Rhinolophus ferrumequinum]|uniref:LOW QUALITY PROTEIN: protein BNIP5 n=1 Tax=Rhinolophus ferrumequinum TaxID=59479 RepID=UPI00140FEDC8|nr:LOW QUALITY PROTEIN: protein BNIP5 [Rhinolophus ferrumequinum]
MEHPRGPKKSLSRRKARSLDRSQDSRKDSWDSRCLSLPTTPCRQELPWVASDGSRRPESPAQPVETQGTSGAALSLEETREFLPSEQRPPLDTKKDKAPRRAQQGWLKSILNFFLNTGFEETKEKASRKAKAKEGLPQPAESSESPGEPAPRKKAHDKKASRKKHSLKKHGEEETKAAPDQEDEGQEAVLPKKTAALPSEEADQGPAPRGGEDSDHQSLLIEGGDTGGGTSVSELSSQATGHLQEEEYKKLDEDTIIRMIVQLLQKVGDHWQEELCQACQPKVALHNTGPASRKKSQEKKPNLRRAFPHKKHGPEEPKRAGTADVSSPDSRPPKRPSYLFLCVGGHRPSNSSSRDLEEPEVQETLSTDCGGPSPSEFSPQAGSPGPEEDLQLDRTSEFEEFIQTIIGLLQDEEEQEGEKQLQVQEPDVAVENLASTCRKKSHKKKSSFRKAFSHKKHGSKEPKRAGATGAASPDSRPPKRPSYLPLCVGGHRSSSLDSEGPEFQESSPAEGGPAGSPGAPAHASSHKPEGRPLPDGASESKELIIQKLVALLQEVDSHLGEQIRRHPSFKRFFYQQSDASLKKLAASLKRLAATLRRQGAHSTKPGVNLAERRYQFAYALANRFAANRGRTDLSLRGLHYRQRCYPHFLYREAHQDITSPESQSPD